MYIYIYIYIDQKLAIASGKSNHTSPYIHLSITIVLLWYIICVRFQLLVYKEHASTDIVTWPTENDRLVTSLLFVRAVVNIRDRCANYGLNAIEWFISS